MNFQMKIDKIDSAIGVFWSASFFIEVLVAVILGTRGNLRSDWFFSITIGILTFLILGFVIQGILTLIQGIFNYFKNN